MKKSHRPITRTFRPRALALAIKQALPWLIGGGLSLVTIAAAQAGDAEINAAFTATQLIRQFTLKNTVSQVNIGLQPRVSNATGTPIAPPMGATISGYLPADMGTISSTVSLPQRDGAGRPLGYCAWDNSSGTSSSSYLAGLGAGTPVLYAVVSAGLNGNVETSCSYILSQAGSGGPVSLGDDYVEFRTPYDVASAEFKASVPSYADLSSVINPDVGEVRLVRDTNRLYAYHQTGASSYAWQPVSLFSDDSTANGANAVKYLDGKVTVADFAASAATLSGALAGTSASFSGAVAANSFTGNGSGLTDLNASQITSGLLAPAFGGTGVDSSAAAPGALLIGNGSGFSLGTMTAGNGIAVLNSVGGISISNMGVLSLTGTADQVIVSGSTGDITLSLPQSIATTSTPTFAGMVLNGVLSGVDGNFSGVLSAKRLLVSDSDGGVTFPNIVLGDGAMMQPASGGGANLAAGFDTLHSNTSGAYNTGVGSYSLYSNTSGSDNSAFGLNALKFNTTGASNTAVGLNALQANTTGYSNAAVGAYAMDGLTIGDFNTAIGENAASRGDTPDYVLTSGSNNTFLGAEAGPAYGVHTLNFATALGSLAEVSTPNTVVLGRTADVTVIGAIGDDGSGNRLQVTGNVGVTGALNAGDGVFAGTLSAKRLVLGDSDGPVTFPNIVIGAGAMTQPASGEGANVAIGTSALASNTTGEHNIAMGYQALTANTTGLDNAAIGFYAMSSNTTGQNNTAIGWRSLTSNLDGSDNTAIGNDTQFYSTSGYGNTSVGSHSLTNTTTGSYNVAQGTYSLYYNTTGYDNVAQGSDALYYNTSGSWNVAAGSSAMYYNSTGHDNVGLGWDSLGANTTGYYNAAVGSGSMDSTTTGYYNAGVGGFVLYSNTTGHNNSGVGYEADVASGDLFYATAIGSESVVSTSNTVVLGRVTDTTVIGDTAANPSAYRLQVHGGLTTDRVGFFNSNVAVGNGSLAVNTGSSNVAVGDNALAGNASGQMLIAIGSGAMANSTSSESVGIGMDALSVSTGTYNVALGNVALAALSTGSANTALGHYALNALTSGDTNIGIGHRSGNDLTSGSRNIFIGELSGTGAASGDSNLAIGNSSLVANGLNHATVIGNDASVTTSNTVVLGRVGDTTVIGATGSASTGDLAGKALQVTGGLGVSGNVALNLNPGEYTQLRDLRVFSSIDNALWDHVQVVVGARTTQVNVGGAENGMVFSVGQGTSGSVGDQTYNKVLTLFPDQSATFEGRVNAQSIYVAGEQVLPVNKANIDNALTFASDTGGASTPESNLALGLTALAGAKRAGNIAVGAGVMNNLSASATETDGTLNTGIGYNALYANSTGYNNTAVGAYTLNANTTGYSNTAVGAKTLMRNTTGYANVAVGQYALLNNTAGYYNVGIGLNALINNGTGYSNVAIGLNALNENTTGYNNVAIGVNTLLHNQAGDSNTALGLNALLSNTNGYGNTATGTNTLQSNTTGFYNVAIGKNAMQNNLDGHNTVAIGANALQANNSGYDNVAVGLNAIQLNNAGYANSAFGVNSLQANTAGFYNTAIGKNAMQNNQSGYKNVAMGYNALHDNTAGFYDTAIGVSALQQSTAGFNSALGAYAMFSNTTGENNVAVGTQALYSNTTGYHNTAVGDLAMYTNSGGYYNTAVGRYALYSAQNGWWNSALGEGALGNLTVGYDNNSIGVRSLYGTTSGIGNNGVGVNAGSTNVDGNFNVLVGDYADVNTSSLSHAAAFGAFSRVASSNTVVLGALSAAKTDGAADDQVVIGATSRDDSYASTKLYVNGTTKIDGALYATSVTQTSDRRLKTNIQVQDSDSVLERLSHLSTYTYDYISHPELGHKIGVIAQEVKPYFPEAVVTSRDGFYSVDYNALGAMAAIGVGKLNVRYGELSTEVKNQAGRIVALETQAGLQDTRITDLERWKTTTSGRLDGMQTAIESNMADIAAHALKITENADHIVTLEQVTTTLSKQTALNTQGIRDVKGVWNDTFEKQDDGQTLALKMPNLKVSNFSAQQMKADAVYTQRLEAEVGKLKTLQVDDLYARHANAQTVHADELNTGSTDTYAGVGNPAFLFAAKSDGHYTVNTSSPDGSYATATVIVYGGIAKVVPVAQQGIELFAVGNQVKANAAGKAIKASWLKMG